MQRSFIRIFIQLKYCLVFSDDNVLPTFGIELSFKKINMIIDGSLFFFFNHQCIALAK